MPTVASASSTLRWQPTLGWLLAAALFLLPAVYSPRIDLFPEEAYYWNYAQHLDSGYLDHPPMVAWLIALGGIKSHEIVKNSQSVCTFYTRVAHGYHAEPGSGAEPRAAGEHPGTWSLDRQMVERR